MRAYNQYCAKDSLIMDVNVIRARIRSWDENFQPPFLAVTFRCQTQSHSLLQASRALYGYQSCGCCSYPLFSRRRDAHKPLWILKTGRFPLIGRFVRPCSARMRMYILYRVSCIRCDVYWARLWRRAPHRSSRSCPPYSHHVRSPNAHTTERTQYVFRCGWLLDPQGLVWSGRAV